MTRNSRGRAPSSKPNERHAKATNRPAVASDRPAIASDRRAILRGAGLATVGGAVWLAAIIVLPNLRAVYETEESALAALQDHRSDVFLGWSMLAVGEALIGLGIWMIARQVSRAELGWMSTVANAAGWAFLGAALTSALIRVWPPSWWASAEDLAQGNGAVWWGVLIGIVWVTLSAAFIALAIVLMKSSLWPTWLGVTLAILGILPLVLFLPLFYWIGAMVLGLVVLLRGAAAPAGSS